MKQEVSGALTAPSLPAWLPMKPQSASIIILAANRELVPVGAKGTNARVSRICRDPFSETLAVSSILSSRVRENKGYFLQNPEKPVLILLPVKILSNVNDLNECFLSINHIDIVIKSIISVDAII